MNSPRTVLLTGASGLVGRHLLDDLKDDYRIFAVARRSQYECGAPVHPNIAWLRADIADRAVLEQALREVATAGGADIVIHLAAYYDFTNLSHPEYARSNVRGTENILTLVPALAPIRFVFASSVAACAFPKPGTVIDEDSPPDGIGAYAWSKRMGERLILDDTNRIPSCIVRLGAVFTDWCEYAPLYVFLKTWLGSSWRSRILAGRGESAVPYIHVRDVVACFRSVIEQAATLPTKIVVHACTPGSTSHKRLYQLTTRAYRGRETRPIFMPVPLARIGLVMLRLMARLTSGERPFEQPWMLKYVDLCLDVRMSHTRELLGWSPNLRHGIERRIPYLLERMRSDPIAWDLRNTRALLRDPDRPGFRLYTVLSTLEYTICEEVGRAVHAPANSATFPIFAAAPKEETLWFVRLLYRLLLSSIHNGNRMLMQHYFEMTSDRKDRSPDYAREVISLLELLRTCIHRAAESHETLRHLGDEMQHAVALPIEFAIDEVLSWKETLTKSHRSPTDEEIATPEDERLRIRSQLEETIWKCLVMRTWDERGE